MTTPFVWRLALAAGLLLAGPRVSFAANARSQWFNDLRQTSLAIRSYHDAHGVFPQNICDRAGKPLLSWRVEILPYNEQMLLYKKFSLDEPWDSAANAGLIQSVPPPYYSYFSEPTRVDFARVCGKGTFFGEGERRSHRDIKGSLSRIIMLVEIDENMPVWTQPGDWIYDPAHPRKGLPSDRSRRFGGRPGFHAVFGDCQVRFVPDSISDELLAALFSADGDDSIPWEFPWYEAALLDPIGWKIVPSLAISLTAIIGGTLVGYRMMRGLPTAPGEMLWFILGTQQLAYVLAFASDYTYELVPNVRHDQKHLQIWFFPSLVGTGACLLAAMNFRRSRIWWVFFIVSFVLVGQVMLDAKMPVQHRRMEESLFTIGAPVLMVWLGGSMACLTFLGQIKALSFVVPPLGGFPEDRLKAELQTPAAKKERAEKDMDIAPRWLAHWSGILFTLVPLAWFLYWEMQGALTPHMMFMRILD